LEEEVAEGGRGRGGRGGELEEGRVRGRGGELGENEMRG